MQNSGAQCRKMSWCGEYIYSVYFLPTVLIIYPGTERKRNMAKRNGFGAYNKISAQQIALIAVSIVALILMIALIVTAKGASSVSDTHSESCEKLVARFGGEINAVQILIDNQKNESGDARIDTLNDIIKHVYAADALSVYKVEAFGGDELITTDTYTRLTELMTQSIQQLESGSRPDDTITEFTSVLEGLISGTEG